LRAIITIVIVVACHLSKTHTAYVSSDSILAPSFIRDGQLEGRSPSCKPVSNSTKSVNSALLCRRSQPRSLQTCISVVVRESEYLSTLDLSPSFPGVIVRDNRLASSILGLQDTTHSTSRLTSSTSPRLSDNVRLVLHNIILIHPVSACCDPHPGTLSTLIRSSQRRGNASCVSQPPILDSHICPRAPAASLLLPPPCPVSRTTTFATAATPCRRRS
jgi:hypothetical protein